MSRFSPVGLPSELAFSGGVRAIAIAAMLALGGVAAPAQELKALMGEVLKTHPRLEASRDDVLSAEAKISDTFRRAWTPNIDISAEDGGQRYESLGAGNTAAGRDLEYWRSSIRANQQLYDFGKSNRQVAEAEAVLSQSKALALSSESGLLLEALSAHWSYVRADKVLDFSRQSEQSVRTQAKMESSMVELGKGYESNVLQAKVQLTSAESRSLKAVGALDIARARVKAVFGEAASKVSYKQLAVIKPEMLPKSLEDEKQIALENNQQIKVGIGLLNTPTHLMSLLAVARLGAASLPLHPRSTPMARRRLITKYGATFILTGVVPANAAQLQSLNFYKSMRSCLRGSPGLRPSLCRTSRARMRLVGFP